MTCKHCGTEIAYKALICYRCGHATTDPVRRPPAPATPSGLLPAAIALALLVVAGLYLGTTATGEMPRAAGIVMLVLAALYLVLRLVRRRPRPPAARR
jgi:hypothetical protein